MRRVSTKRARILETDEDASGASRELRSSTLKALRLQLSASNAKLSQTDLLDWSETPAATARKSGKRLIFFNSQELRQSEPSTARARSTCTLDDVPFEMYLYILGDFTLHQLLTVQLVSQHWKSVVDYVTERLVRAMFGDYNRDEIPTNWCRYMLELDYKLRQLRLRPLLDIFTWARERGHERCMVQVAREQPSLFSSAAVLERHIGLQLALQTPHVHPNAQQRVLLELLRLYQTANGDRKYTSVFVAAIVECNTAGFEVLVQFFREHLPGVCSRVIDVTQHKIPLLSWRVNSKQHSSLLQLAILASQSQPQKYRAMIDRLLVLRSEERAILTSEELSKEGYHLYKTALKLQQSDTIEKLLVYFPPSAKAVMLAATTSQDTKGRSLHLLLSHSGASLVRVEDLLRTALAARNLTCIRLLLSQDAVNVEGLPLVGTAITAELFDVASVLLDKGASSAWPVPILSLLMQYRQQLEARRLFDRLSTRPALHTQRDSKGVPPLLFAFEHFLPTFVDVYAAVVMQLLDNGANINITDTNGDGVLMYAVRKGLPWGEIQLLIGKGAQVTKVNNSGQSALFANTRYQSEVVRGLIDAGAPTIDSQGNTILHHLAPHASPLILGYLCDRFPTYVNQKNQNGDTPLHMAVQGGQVNAVSLLTKRGADPWIANNQGQSPARLPHTKEIDKHLKRGCTIL